jgi:RimJ/RimL family protein N-acetyltransferase
MKIDNADYDLIPFDVDIFNANIMRYRLWMNDPHVTKFNSHGLFAKTPDEIASWIDSMNKKETLCWMLLNPAGEWIGVISLQSFNWIYRTAEIAMWIGDKNEWGKGLATHMIYFVCGHGFDRMNLNRIWSGTAETNRGMQKAFERNAFRKEGVFRQGMFLSGRYADIFCYSLLAKDWVEKEQGARHD